jgi:exosortase
MEQPAPKKFDVIAPILGIAALLISMWPTVFGILSRWAEIDEAYSHGYLLLGMSLWLSVQAWRKERPVVSLYPLWLIPFILGLAAYAVGELLLIQALRDLVVVPIIMLALLVLWGWRQFLPFLIPVGIVFLAIPVWDFSAYTLQQITVVINDLLLGLMDIEFRIEGIYVYLIGVGTFEIAHGCSGLRYLLVSLVLTSVYGHLNFRLWKTRILLVAIGVGFALLANWIRVFVIIYMGYETNMTSSLIEDHEFFGWIVFAGTLVPLMLLARKLEDVESKDENRTAGPTSSPSKRGSLLPKVGLAAVVLLPLAVAGASEISSRGSNSAVTTIKYSPLTSPWVRIFQKDKLNWMPQFSGADITYEDVFVNPASATGSAGESFAAVGLYTYLKQAPGKKLVQYSNKIYSPETWVVEKTFELTTESGSPMSGLVLRKQLGDKKLHVAYAYYVEGTWVDSAVEAKLAPLLGSFNSRNDASLISLAVDCSDSCNPKEQLEAIASSVENSVRKSLDDHFSGDVRNRTNE